MIENTEKKNKKVRAFTLDDITFNELKEMSQKTSISMSSLIRLMVKKYKNRTKSFLN
jgi:predicted DNA-binding ribbon-helix-helix protein